MISKNQKMEKEKKNRKKQRNAREYSIAGDGIRGKV